MARRIRILAPLALAAVMLAGTFARALGPGQVLFGTDAFLLFLPMRAFMHDAFMHGIWPAWFPFDGPGTPMLGSLVPMALDPTTLLGLPLPPHDAVKLQVFAAYVTAGAGAFLLARALKLPTIASTFGALAYACTGYLVSLSSNPQYLTGAARIPLVLWAALRLRQRGQWRHASALAIAIASMLWCGDPEGLLLAVVIVIPLAARRPLQLAVAGALSLAMTAPLLLPAIHTYGGGTRAAALDPGEALAWSVHPVRLAELLVGSPFLNADDAAIAPFAPHNGGFWSLSNYVGAGVLALAIRGLVRRGARWRILVALGGALALVLAMGVHAGLYARLPLLMHFRYPEKLVPWAALAIALLAARGLTGVGRGHLRWLLAALVLCLGAAWIGAIFAPGLWLLGVRAVGVILALGLAARAIPRPTWRMLLASGVALGDLAVSAQPLLIHAPLAGLPTASTMPEAQPGDRICSDLELEGFAGLPKQGGPTQRRAQLNSLSYDLPGLVGLRSTGSLIPTETPDMSMLCGVIDRCGTPCSRIQGARWQLLQRATAERLVSTGEYRRIRDLELPRATLVEDLRAPPYASVRPALVYDDAHALGGQLYRHEVPTGASALLARNEVPADAATWSGSGIATATAERPDRIRIQANASAPSVLVVQEAFNRDWRATLDGVAAPVLRADFGLLGVALPAGGHAVMLEYVPVGHVWTPIAYLAGLLAAVALVVRDLRRAR